jgi:hypothetical protein
MATGCCQQVYVGPLSPRQPEVALHRIEWMHVTNLLSPLPSSSIRWRVMDGTVVEVDGVAKLDLA